MAITGLNGATTNEERGLLNRMNSHALKTRLGDKIFSHKVCFVGKYDFAVQGGAVSTINLVDAHNTGTTLATVNSPLKVPANFVITNVIIDRVTSPGAITSGTISLGINSTADLLAATNMTAFDGTTLLAGIPVGTAATAVKVTADTPITATIATTALTAGKFYVSVEGFLSRSF